MKIFYNGTKVLIDNPDSHEVHVWEYEKNVTVNAIFNPDKSAATIKAEPPCPNDDDDSYMPEDFQDELNEAIARAEGIISDFLSSLVGKGHTSESERILDDLIDMVGLLKGIADRAHDALD